MPTPPAHLATVLSLAAVLSQFGCGRAVEDGNDDGSSGGASSGGTTSTGGAAIGTGGSGTGGAPTSSGGNATSTGGVGSGGTAGSGGDASGGTGGTACPELPHSPCGEGGCNVGDSYPGGTGLAGENGDECLYEVIVGPTGACDPAEPDMGPCNECFCQYGEWLCWQPDCP